MVSRPHYNDLHDSNLQRTKYDTKRKVEDVSIKQNFK